MSELTPIDAVRQRTPARLLEGRAGPAYRTTTSLQLRADHAAARDAVLDEVDAGRLPPLLEVTTRCQSKQEFLLRPDLGRLLSPASRQELAEKLPRQAALQVFVGDGLSAAAVHAQVPILLPALLEAASTVWAVGVPFFVRYCRVGVLNDIGDVLAPEVCVLLIGERPGLATAEGLSAYLAYRPRPGHTDAQRNLISNIHARGVPPLDAVPRILALAAEMRRLGKSGVEVKERLPASLLTEGR
jgi:ethanolamine ammonia-lyase small subunit